MTLIVISNFVIVKYNIVVFVMFSSSFTFVTWSICHFHCVEDWVRMEKDDANS